ncbi:MAG: DUF1015 domain-containing protein [Anaerolineaceae bacterium]
MKTYNSIGIRISPVLLPKPGTDLTKWAVIACDQFTSQPEYWDQVKNLVGDSPSTFNLILPEVYLGKPEEAARLKSTQQAMHDYLDKGVFAEHEGFIYLERTVAGKTRKGIMLCLDLEKYDFNKGSSSLIRATEGTILDRLPPRMKIREGALLELPHIMVLIDDPEHKIIEPLRNRKAEMTPLYDFDLMLGSGHLEGYLIQNAEMEKSIVAGIEKLADPSVFRSKYNLDSDQPVLLFAMGDGNHSLATAKAIWEKIKPQVGMDHPARYALVEIENVHDEGLDFEPIHRVLFDVKTDLSAAMREFYGSNLTLHPCKDQHEMVAKVDGNRSANKMFGVITPTGFFTGEVSHPATNLPVGTLQAFLDPFVKAGNVHSIDYVHGEDVVCELGAKPGNAGFYLPAMDKSDLFKTVILDGALPRKTFSMGEAKEKRFYMECRRIA